MSSFVYNRSKRARPARCPHLSMSQSDPRILREIKAYLGYGVVWHNRLTIRGKKNVIHFADYVGPHLRVKRKRVLLAKEMALLVDNHNRPPTDEVIARREELGRRISGINRAAKNRMDYP